MNRMYQLKEPKSEAFSNIETDSNDMLPGLGNRFISLHYHPTDVDYQIAAISYHKAMGMHAAEQLRDQRLSLDSSEFDTARDCYYFSMRDLNESKLHRNDLRERLDYGLGYVTSLALQTSRNPLEVLDEHLNNINDHYESEHGAKPDNPEEFRDAVLGYYVNELNFGKPAYEIQAQMDAKAAAQSHEKTAGLDNGQEFDDFADAVAGIQQTEQGLNK